MTRKLPSIVIVGRPNVGKSTLFNRLTGTRRSIVTNEPGITRDRIYGKAEWEGREFELVDTGGIVPEDKAGIPGEILRQARVAIENASCVVQVVDGRTGPVPLDEELAQLLRRAGKPPVLAVNKVDSPKQAELAAQFYELGDRIFPISAEHGFGIDTLLDSLTQDFPVGEVTEAQPDVSIAIIGRPNVGKSTLLNQLVGAERSIVSPEPGTTRDAVDTVVEHNGKKYRFLDTAGIRRKGKTNLIAEKLSVIMARRHLERADVAILVADASVGVTSHDATIASYAEQSGRSVIIVMNKWDLALKAAQEKAEKEKRVGGKGGGGNPSKLLADYEPMVRGKLKFLSYAPLVFLSALTGDRVTKLYAQIDRVVEARNRRISTGRAQSLARECRSRPRNISRQPPRKDLLHHSGDGSSAHVRAVHQPDQAAALQLSALPRKPPARRLRLHRHAHPLHAAAKEARRPRHRKKARGPRTPLTV